MPELIFIDTNILLDFYRVRGREGGLAILDHIDGNQDRIITTAQVEMEYKKNRQTAILEGLKQVKTPDWGSLTLPAFLAESRPRKNIEKSRKTIDAQRRSALERIEKLLSDPSRTDPVYKVLQRLFKADTHTNLSRAKKERYAIRRHALKRFLLGYPPRKSGDTSYGDAVNWEWVIDCATRVTDDITIVSRDSDYGATHGDESFLNDWLREEFKQRVSRKRNITLTTRLTEAFKRANVRVTRVEEEAEQNVIEERKVTRERRTTPAPPEYYDTKVILEALRKSLIASI